MIKLHFSLERKSYFLPFIISKNRNYFFEITKKFGFSKHSLKKVPIKQTATRDEGGNQNSSISLSVYQYSKNNEIINHQVVLDYDCFLRKRKLDKLRY
jgi:hypothetical protein